MRSRTTFLTALLVIAAAVVPVVGAPPASAAPGPGTFTGITPMRILDTREPGQGPCISGTARTVTVAPLAAPADVPANAAAVALNVTVVGASGPGFLTVYPAGTTRPTNVSSLNYVVGSAVPNNVQVKVGSGGGISLFASNGCPQAIVDVVGWYAAGTPVAGRFTGVAPGRLLDTGVAGSGGCISGVRALGVVGRFGVPGDAAAVALNVTVDNSTAGASGYLTAYPAGVPRPTASTLNYRPGDVVPNGTIVRVGTSGAINLFTFGGCVRVVVDVVGWYTGGAPIASQGFAGLTPARVLDRSSFSVCPDRDRTQVASFDLPIAAAIGAGVPADALAVSVNVTVDGPVGPGFLTVHPAGAPRPTASSLNYGAGATVANGVLTKLGAGGAITIYSNAGCPRIVVDVLGTFVAAHQPPQQPATPVWPNVSDPAVLRVGTVYYVYGSNLLVQGTPVRIPVRAITDPTYGYPLTGTDSWDAATGEALSSRPAWADPGSSDFWAPTVGQFGASYVMFFAARRSGVPAPNDQCIARAVASSPAGPFVPDAGAFTCGIQTSTAPWGGGALDPEVFTAPGGAKYLLAAFSDTNQPLRAIPLTADGRGAGAPVVLAGLEFGWEFPFIENPSMVATPAGDFLLAYSAGDWRTGAYSTGTARCTTPLGPCAKAPARSPWLVSGRDRSGVGGLTFFSKPDGTVLAAYASWNTDCERILSPTAAPRACRDDAAGVFPWRQGSTATVDFGVLSPAPLLR
ncbi:MAG: family 43 glycosylhydrolase [Actinomycetes bacterium]